MYYFKIFWTLVILFGCLVGCGCLANQGGKISPEVSSKSQDIIKTQPTCPEGLISCSGTCYNSNEFSCVNMKCGVDGSKKNDTVLMINETYVEQQLSQKYPCQIKNFPICMKNYMNSHSIQDITVDTQSGDVSVLSRGSDPTKNYLIYRFRDIGILFTITPNDKNILYIEQPGYLDSNQSFYACGYKNLDNSL